MYVKYYSEFLNERKWTFEKCEELIKNYNSRNDLKVNNKPLYDAISRNGWMKFFGKELDNRKRERDDDKLKKKIQNIKDIASRYNNRTEFEKNEQPTFWSAYRLGIIDDITQHMELSIERWTYDDCKEEMLKYNSRSEFEKYSPKAYKKAWREKWLQNEFGEILDKKRDDILYNYYKQECLKYDSFKELRKNDEALYRRAKRKGWGDEIVKLLNEKEKDILFELVRIEALKYNTRKEFQTLNKAYYLKAWSNNWLDEICSHMIPQGSLKKRYIYAYEFPKLNSVYVGLSWNLDERHKQHMSRTKSSVNEFLLNNNLQEDEYFFKELGYFDMKIAGLKEQEFENDYKTNGWVIINKAKTGGLGGGRVKWTYKKCKETAIKYDSINDFQKENPGAYFRIKTEGWEDILDILRDKKIELIYDFCKMEASKFNTRNEFKKSSYSAYTKSHRYKNKDGIKWIDIFLPK